MNFDFSDDIRAMAAEVRRAMERHCPMSEVRGCLATGQHSAPVWRALGELGVLGAAVPEQWGGGGLGMLELAACAEEVGRACAPVPILPSVFLATEALLLAGTDAQKARWLPELAAGRAIGTVVFAPLHVEGVHATGRLAQVPAGAAASVLIAIGDDGSGACVALDEPRVRRLPLTVLDPGYPMADLELDRTAAESMVAGPGAATLLRDRAAALLAFDQLGAAERALDMARDYVMHRRSFGRIVASYQAVKHRLADVWARNQLARSHAYHGAWALARAPQRLALAAAGARVAATEALEFAAQENVQLHGGIGFTWEADCHPLYKRARSTALALGPIGSWKRRISRELAAGLPAH